MPGGKIVINRGLLVELKDEAELAAVLGHEITHATARHGAKDMERQMAMAVGLLAAGIALEMNTDPNDVYTVPAAMAGAQVATNLVSKKYSRGAELEADHYGMDYMVRAGYDPMAAVDLQETFVRLSKEKSSNWMKGLFATHPPSEARVKANLAYARTLPSGKRHADVYQQKIAKLKKRKNAYDAYDEGVKAFEKKNLPLALTLVDKAIAQEPNEALFYGLKGDIFAKQKNQGKALSAYNQAISKDSDYFYYYLKRGLTYQSMHQYASAKADLKRSQNLLPTQLAENALRQIG
jgi:predicted Zn-dependent protease